MKPSVAELLAGLRKRRFWAEIVAATLVVVVPAVLVASRSAHRTVELRQRERQLARTTNLADLWTRGFRSATPAESAAWHRSERQVAQRGIRSVDRVGLAQLVTQRAEELGIPDVGVTFVSADSLETAPARTVGEWTFRMAPYALVVEFTTGYDRVLSYVGSLPPQVEVRELRLRRTDGGVHARFLLVVFEGSDGSKHGEGE
jgi:hypothetical protein